ncbi:phage portal protein [Cohnella thailandensis]|uniref:Phage portal protein n=1 Tax=Cohnella thailandensis TaxID=557557 RepID=A0A841SJT1_9BACL|nr:phage portal protein [Cohnella thailandensis]MBB6632773.1 phage portal protein [Cohnella thailandensis]MBP1975537.1 SPP1 family phage portal protein [Cohnella thailandensis]
MLFGPTQTDAILANLAANAPMGQDRIVYNAVKDWLGSEELSWMMTGERYYRNKPDILYRKKYAIGPDGEPVEVKNVANNKLVNGFMKKLTDQKVGYLLSKLISVQAENKAYLDILTEDYVNDDFQRQLQNLGKECIQKGRAWLHPYYDEDGAFRLKRFPSQELIPLWRDNDHTELDAMIRVYSIITYEADARKKVTKVEYWDSSGVYRYVYEDKQAIPDIECGAYSPHFVIVNPDGAELPYNWTKVPFICFKYNAEEQGLLEQIKTLIDDYDRQKSDNSNKLEDTPDDILILKNYDGTNLGEFRKNLLAYRAVKVSDDGGLDSLSADLNPEAHKQHQEQSRKDIYEFGRGVDTQSDRFGGDPSGIALKFLYADLDMDCNMIETEFQFALRQLLWFINAHLANSGAGDFEGEKVTFIFNRDILINETEAINNAKSSVGVISDETIVANHPWVTDAQDELDRIKEERETAMDDYGTLGARRTGTEEPNPAGEAV